MTKAEFVDRLARDGRIDNKKKAGDAVEAVLDGITEALVRGDSVNFTGLRKVQRRRARTPPRRQPADRRADHDRRRPRAEVLGRRRAEVQGQGLSGLTAPFADRLVALVEERRSQVCLGLDPDPSRLGPEAGSPGDPPAQRAADGGRGALPLADRARWARVRRRQAPARLLRAPRRAGLGGARAHRRRRAGGRADRDRRRQARRRPGERLGLRAGAVRLDAHPVG